MTDHVRDYVDQHMPWYKVKKRVVRFWLVMIFEIKLRQVYERVLGKALQLA